ncbi:MAG: hypothetical protein FWD31_14390 [Planctomycetaceae bacterium]|nr:hypothetical protein [Planctomycetaceae bacterium]
MRQFLRNNALVVHRNTKLELEASWRDKHPVGSIASLRIDASLGRNKPLPNITRIPSGCVPNYRGREQQVVGQCLFAHSSQAIRESLDFAGGVTVSGHC